MEKRIYVAPAMETVQMEHEARIFETSSKSVRGRHSIEDWGDGETTNEDIYM